MASDWENGAKGNSIAEAGQEQPLVYLADSTGMILPDETNLLHADYARRGDDLLIGANERPALVILDYFSSGQLPDLATEGGAVLTGQIVAKLAGPDQEKAGETSETPDQDPIGHVESAEGTVIITRADGSQVIAVQGTPIFEDDVVITDGAGSVGLRFVDGMTMSLGSDARMVLDEFVYNPEAHEGGGIIEIIQGAFSFISGEAAHMGLDSMVIETPTMTIGIRGTKVVANAAAEGETTEVVLLPEDDGTIGKIMISTDAGQELLEQPFVSTTVTSRFLPPASQSFVTPEWVYSHYSEPLAALPTPTVEYKTPDRNIDIPSPKTRERFDGGEEPQLASDLVNEPWKQEAEAAEAAAVTRSGKTLPEKSTVLDDASDSPGVAKTSELSVEFDIESSNDSSPDTSQTKPDLPIIDNEAPVVDAPIANAGAAEDAAFSYDVSASFSDGDLATGDALTFSAAENGSASLPTWLSIDGATGILSGTPTNASVGTLSLTVTATDKAGASAAASFQLTISNSNDAPVVVTPIADTSAAEDAAFSYDASANLADDDTIHGDTLAFSATLSGGAPLPAWLSIDPATGILSGTPANTDIGVVTVDVTATDDAGANVTDSFQLTVTNTNDTPVIVTPITDTSNAEDAAFNYDVSAGFADNDSVHGDTLAFSASLSGGAPLPAWLSIDPATGVLSGTPANDDVGVITVDVTATDDAGANVTDSFQLTVTNTNDAPVIVTPITDTSNAEDAAFNYDASVNFGDDDAVHGDTLAFSATLSGGAPLPAWLSIDPATGILSGTPANDDVGVITVDVTATDDAGANVTDSFQLTVTNTNDTPVIVTPIADTSAAEDAAFSYDASANLADDDTIHGDTLAFSATLSGGAPLPAWLSIDPATGILSGTPANDDVGVITVDVTATDDAGANVTDSFQLTVTNTNDTPVIVTPIADTSAAEDAAFSYDASANFGDDDTIHGDTLAFSATLSGGAPLPAWLSIDPATGVLSGTPANDDVGVITVDVTATDDAGANVTDSFQLTVTNTNDAPVATTSIAFTSTNEDAAFSHNASTSFTDDDSIHGDTLTYAATQSSGAPLPAWLSIDPATGVLSGTPANDDVGQLIIEITAADADGVDTSTTLDLTITNSNDAPVIVTPIADATPLQDIAFSYDISANFADDDTLHGDTLTFSAEQNGGAPLPAWLSIDPATGVLSGTPDFTQSGIPYTIDVTATDGQSTSVTSTFQLTVDNVNDAPVLNVTPSPSMTAVSVNATDPAGNTIAEIVVDGSITDPDGGAVEAIALTAVDDTNGTFEFSTNGGSSWTAVGAVSDSSAILLDGTARLRFVPDPGYGGSADFSFRAWDQNTGSNGQTGVDVTTNGGSTAFSTDTDTGSVTVRSGNPDLSTGSEFQINTTTADKQEAPSVTALSDGGFVVVWHSDNQDGDKHGIYGQRYDSAGSAVGSEFQINTATTEEQKEPSIAALADGGFVVTWESKDQDGDLYGIYGQRYDSGGSAVGAEFQINTTATDEQKAPEIVSLADGGFVVVWESKDQDGDKYGIYGQRYDSAGSTVGAEFQINTTTADEQKTPSVAALADGGFVVTWESSDQDGDRYGIYGQRFDSGGSAAGSEFQINTTTADEQKEPSVAALEDGGFIVAWQSKDQDGDNWGIYGQRYDSSGNAVEFEFQINQETAGEQREPSVAALADGGFIVTWQSKDQDGDNWGIYGRRYSADGDPLGDEFQINTTTADEQKEVDVATLGDGGLAVTWQSRDQDGDNWGVFGHVYESETASVTVNPPQAEAANMLDFGGTNSYVDVGTPGQDGNDLDPGLSDYTVEAWFYYDGANGTQTIVSKGNDGSLEGGFNIFLDGNELVVRASIDGSIDSAARKITMSGPPGWHHVAMVLDQESGTSATRIKGYLDGSDAGWSTGHGLVISSTMTTSESKQINADERFLIGASDDAGTAEDFFDGEIADVRVWNTARSQAEIQADMGRTLNGDEPHLLANWQLDDGSGSTAADSTGRYDGTISGGPAWQNALSLTTAQNTTLAGRLSASDPEGDTLTYSVDTNASNGTASIDADDGTWTYDPSAGFSGSDSFSYQVSDGNGGTDTVTIAVTVTP